MLYGVDAEGNRLSQSECRDRLTNDFPQSPFPLLLGISEALGSG